MTETTPRTGVAPKLRMVLSLGAALVLAACGSGGHEGGTDTNRYAASRDVIVQDAPILGVVVQDRDGGVLSQTAEPVLDVNGLSTGRYQFPSQPVLPLRISSQNLVGADGTVKITRVNDQWFSYTDTNANGAFDTGEPTKPLSFQDLDGNGIFTQTADVLYNGRFNVDYVPANATVVHANAVSSLIPANWNGSDPVAGLPAAVLNAAVTTGPQASTSMELKKIAALLTAVAEALLSNNLATAANLPAIMSSVAQSTNALSSAANPADLGALVAKVLPADKQAEAARITANLKAVADKADDTISTNFESLVKLAVSPEFKTDLKTQTLSTARFDTLVAQVTNGSSQITEDKKTATAGVDPEAALISSMRLVPWHELFRIESQLPIDNSYPFGAIGKTTGFALAKNATGSLQLRAIGSPFAEVIGATGASTLPFVTASGNWQAFTATTQGIVVDIKSGFQLPGTTSYVPGAVLRVCQTSVGGCWPFMLATPNQVCALMNSGTFKTNATMRQTALTAINAINSAQTAVTCP